MTSSSISIRKYGEIYCCNLVTQRMVDAKLVEIEVAREEKRTFVGNWVLRIQLLMVLCTLLWF